VLAAGRELGESLVECLVQVQSVSRALDDRSYLLDLGNTGGVVGLLSLGRLLRN
jgi:hypothetical protein